MESKDIVGLEGLFEPPTKKGIFKRIILSLKRGYISFLRRHELEETKLNIFATAERKRFWKKYNLTDEIDEIYPK